MGVKVEFNQELTLRAHGAPSRKPEECLPKELIVGQKNNFLKEGQRVYRIDAECELHETKGNQQVSPPLASIHIIEFTHFLLDGKTFTKGVYEIKGLK